MKLSDVTEDEDEQQMVEFSIIKLQSLVRLFIIRAKLLKSLNERYEKIFAPSKKMYYCYDRVKDTSSWRKPRLLLNKDIHNIAPTYTKDEAATMLQTRVRMMSSMLRVRMLYQSVLISSVDEGSGATYFYNPRSEATMWDLPPFMRGRMDYEKKLPIVRPPKTVKRATKTDGKRRSTLKGSVEDDVSGSDEDDDDEEGLPSLDPDGDNSSEVTGLSDDSEAVRERRRQHRRYPR